MKRNLGRWILALIAGLIGFGAFQANADITITDDGFNLSPDPVHIVVGEVVFWQDDGTGPYAIISDSGAWQPFYTPGGLFFNQTGTYSYHDDTGNFGTVYVSPNIPPSVTITNPATN